MAISSNYAFAPFGDPPAFFDAQVQKGGSRPSGHSSAGVRSSSFAPERAFDEINAVLMEAAEKNRRVPQGALGNGSQHKEAVERSPGIQDARQIHETPQIRSLGGRDAAESP